MALRPQHPSPRPLHGLADAFGFEVLGRLGGLETTGEATHARREAGWLA